MAMGAGKLDTRCSFEKPVEASDGGGGTKITWTEQFTRWGAFALASLAPRSIAFVIWSSSLKATLTP